MSEKRKLTESEKEARFNAKMDRLDAKVKARRQKREARLRKRADYLSEHPIAKYAWMALKTVVIGLIVAFVYFISTISLKLYDDYHNSVKWTKITGPKLAEQDPELLYSTASDKKLKLKLTEKINAVWDFDNHEFKSSVDKAKIDEIKSLYSKAKDPKDNITKKYNELMTFWDARETLLGIFTDTDFKEIKENVSVQDMSDTVDKVFDKVDDFLVKGNNYKQANTYRDITYALANDANTYASVITQFSKSYDISRNDNKLKIKTNMSTKELDSLINSTNMLSYKYDLITKFVSPILKASKAPVARNTKNKAAYAEYEADVNAKNNYASYYDQYVSTMNALKASVVDYVSFEGKNISDLQQWASDNNIHLNTTEQNSDKQVGTILSQSPSTNKYTKIVKGSSIDVVVAKKNVASYNTSSSSSSSSRSNSSSNSNSSNSSSSQDSFSTDSSSATPSSRRNYSSNYSSNYN